MLQLHHPAVNALLAGIGIVGFILFLLPVLAANILNVGNGFGMAMNALLVVFALWNDRISALLTQLCSRKAGKAVFGAVSVLFVGCVLLCLVISGCMLGKILRQPEQKPSVLLVLGCKVNGEQPSRMLRYRLDAAYTYLTENPDSIAVVSGGQGADEGISEALCMYRNLTARGIAPERIYMEDKSTSTEENFAFSKELLAQNGVQDNTFAVATDGFHQLRASMLADRDGIQTVAVSAKTELWLFPTYWVREWFGVVYTVLFQA